ncbi:MAG: hypothetical protein RSB29_02145 [Alistipes sp.]
MKKILLCLPVLALFTAGFVGCTQLKAWDQKQRQSMRTALQNYRQMAYLEDLNDAEFVLFANNVAVAAETAYPSYTEFVALPAVGDSIDMIVVSSIVQELNADAANMRHIYPYASLVGAGVLPAGLDHAQRKAFYTCFASKVSAAYATMGQFFNAILADTTNVSQIAQMQSACANNLFNWVVTEVQVEETVVN